MIAERGVAATRVADVAERVDVSPAAVLYWFDSKEQLLAEALIADDERFYAELGARLERAGDARERLRLLLAAAAESAGDFSLWMELWTWALRDAALREARERFDARWRASIAAIVREGQLEGVFGAIDAGEAALVLASLIDGLTVQVALGDPEVDERQLEKTTTAIAERLLECELPPAAEGDRASP